LYRRINERVLAMVEQGLVDEVRRLLELGYRPGDPGVDATGYVELIPYLRGEVSLDDAVDQIQRATRRYARRQETWFRNQLPGAVWLDATRPTGELVEEIVRTWTEGDP
jgi:tRNA dimethylallyltransferase